MQKAFGARHLARARELYILRRYDLAITAALDATAADPSDVYALVVLANSHERLGHIREAEAAAVRAIATASQLPRPHTALGMVRLLQRRYPEALASFREAIRIAPEYGEAYRLAAHAEMLQMHYGEALTLVDRALEIDPESISALEVRAMVFRKSGRAQDAERAVADILRRDPENALGLRSEGLLQLVRGNGDVALATLREALRLDPTSVAARAAYARVVIHTGPAKHYRVLTFVLYLSLVVAGGAGSRGGLDYGSVAETYAGISILRRSIELAALGRDEISRSFAEPAERAANATSAGLGVLAIAAATLEPALHARALTVLAGGLIVAAVAQRGATLADAGPGVRRGYRIGALGAIAFAALLAAAMALGGRAAGIPRVPWDVALPVLLAFVALLAAFARLREPVVFLKLVRSVVPPRRQR